MLPVRLPIATLVITCLSCMFAGCASQAPIVGAWQSGVQFRDGDFAAIKDLQFLYVFHADGTMTESSNYDGAPPVPPAYGVWRESGPSTFEARYVFFTTKPPGQFDELTKGGGWVPTGHGVLTERLHLNPAADAFDSTITLDLYDTAGKPVGSSSTASGHGTRVTLSRK